MNVFDDALIENVKKYPVLYRTRGKNYKNIISKGNCWIKIAAALNKTPEECKSKWRNIRDNYVKNRKKKNSGGPAVHSKYNDERLDFLGEAYEDTDSLNNMDNSTNNFECEIIKEEYDSSEDVPLSESPFILEVKKSANDTEQPPTYTPILISNSLDSNSQPIISNPEERESSPPRKVMKRKKGSIIDELRKDREEKNLMLQELINKSSDIGNSPIHKFFSSMADIVHNFPPDKVVEARVKVCSLISEMELEVLKGRNQTT